MIHVMITDLHSHIPSPDAVLSLDPSDPSQIPSKAPLFTCGLHPWNADRFSPELLDKLRQMLGRPGCLGLGEAGLDAMRGPAIDLQTAVFEAQARLAIEMELPMVIHCVRAHEPLIALYRRLRPARPWIIHGFRGKPAVARRLLDASRIPLHLHCSPSHIPSPSHHPRSPPPPLRPSHPVPPPSR